MIEKEDKRIKNRNRRYVARRNSVYATGNKWAKENFNLLNS